MKAAQQRNSEANEDEKGRRDDQIHVAVRRQHGREVSESVQDDEAATYCPQQRAMPMERHRPRHVTSATTKVTQSASAHGP